MRRSKNVNQSSVSEEAAFELGVVYSAVKDELVAFAAKEGSPYSFADVAARVSKLLQAEALREQLRNPEYLSQMRQNGANNHPGRPPKSGRYELAATAALLQGSSADRPLKRRMSPEARQRISEAQSLRWAKLRDEKRKESAGWTPARRKKYAKMMKKRWANPKTRPKLTTKGRKYSAETRAKISASRKAYWDRIRAEQGQR